LGAEGGKERRIKDKAQRIKDKVKRRISLNVKLK
jgi:hypothetical protein